MHAFSLQVGPVGFRIGSAWRKPVRWLASLYAGYPSPEQPCDFTVRLEPMTSFRKWLRPSIRVGGDYMLPGASPLSLDHGLLAAELGMNLQMALGQKRYLLLHAATVEKDGRAVLLTGESGAGKSTLAALLGESGWRLMGDEFALLDLEDARLVPFPRAISLKNGAIAVMERRVDSRRFGPILSGTPKGTIRHLRPNEEAIARMSEPARPSLILFPRYDAAAKAEIRPVGAAEVFVRLTQASTNYVSLGRPGFAALSALVTETPACAIDYSDAETAIGMVDSLWTERGS